MTDHDETGEICHKRVINHLHLKLGLVKLPDDTDDDDDDCYKCNKNEDTNNSTNYCNEETRSYREKRKRKFCEIKGEPK